MEDELDRLLAGEPLTVPEDFTMRVMARLPGASPDRPPSRAQART